MALKMIGQANHVFENGEITHIQIETITFNGQDEDRHAVVLRHEYNDESLMIHSREQAKQLIAIINKAFDTLD